MSRTSHSILFGQVKSTKCVILSTLLLHFSLRSKWRYMKFQYFSLMEAFLRARFSKHTDDLLLFLHMLRNPIKYKKGIVSGNSTKAFDLPTVESIAWGGSALYSYTEMWNFIPELFDPDKQIHRMLRTAACCTHTYIYIFAFIRLFILIR